ncbi:MAG: FMN-binding negative transcriptional regulator [Gemmatimonadota bacterium]|nr:FMN-binding negative transcriptional regulator [Gemmatimonadota bacterium]
MYVPTHFAVTDIPALHALIRAHPLGTMVVPTGDGLDANHLPFVLRPQPAPFGTLHGHVARPNPVWRSAMTTADSLVIFQGPERYVSPAWYPSKADTEGRVVPTWNYVVVHAYATLRVVDDRAWVLAHLEELVAQHEGARTDPWRMSDAPADWIERLADGVVGVELAITRLIGKSKLSQNRSPADRAGVVEGLTREDQGGAAMAEAMRRAMEG